MKDEITIRPFSHGGQHSDQGRAIHHRQIRRAARKILAKQAKGKELTPTELGILRIHEEIGK